MDFYNATVRLGGDVRHEVQKTDLSAPEVMVLKELHGFDGVIKIEPSGKVIPDGEFDQSEERQRLTETYADGLNALENKNSINEMFGRREKLPTQLPEFRENRKVVGNATKAKKVNAEAVI